MAYLEQVNLASSSQVSGTLPASHGGTGQTTGYGALSYIRCSGGTQASTNTHLFTYATVEESSGSDVTRSVSAVNGDTFTVNTSGIYCVTFNAFNGSNGTAANIHVNSSLVDSTASTNSHIRTWQSVSANFAVSTTWTGYIASGQVVWGQLNNTAAAGAYFNQLSIARIA